MASSGWCTEALNTAKSINRSHIAPNEAIAIEDKQLVSVGAWVAPTGFDAAVERECMPKITESERAKIKKKHLNRNS